MRVHVLLATVQLCFASLAIVGRVALRDIPPNAIVLTRVAGGALVFTALARAGGAMAIRRDDVLRFVACAILGVVTNQLLFVNGLALSTATSATMLGATIPVFTATFAVLLGVERWRGARFAGIILALAGALALIAVRPADGRHGSNPTLGNTIIVINCLSYALFLVVVRPLTTRYRPMTLVAVLFAIGTLFVAPFGVPAWIELAPRLTGADVALLAFILAVPTVGAYALNQLAMRDAEPSLVAAYIYLQPVFGTLGAILLLGERPGLETAVAAALIFTGLYVSSRQGARATSRATQGPREDRRE